MLGLFIRKNYCLLYILLFKKQFNQLSALVFIVLIVSVFLIVLLIILFAFVALVVAVHISTSEYFCKYSFPRLRKTIHIFRNKF